MERHDQVRLIAAARAVAAGGTDAIEPATRLISAAEALVSVIARVELGDEPRLLSVTATPLADVARVKDMLRAIPASAPPFLDTGERRELRMTIEQGHRHPRHVRSVERTRGGVLTPPIDRGREIRCYIRDPDGHLSEMEQSTGVLEGGTPA